VFFLPLLLLKKLLQFLNRGLVARGHISQLRAGCRSIRIQLQQLRVRGP
jgi:hypothetical protein